jgi:hypothetical protein
MSIDGAPVKFNWLEERRASASEIAGRLGGTSSKQLKQIDVVPRDQRIARISIVADGDETGVNHAIVVPAATVSLAELREAFGAWSEGKRLHADSPRKAFFEERPRAGEYWTQIVAETDPNAAMIDASPVQRVLIVRNRTAAATSIAEGEIGSQPSELWEPLREGVVGFAVRCRRLASLEDMRQQAAQALGCVLTACDILGDGSPAYCATTPATRVRINSWPAEDGTGRSVFHLVGEAEQYESEVDVSEPLAARLRSIGGDWYVPTKLEYLEEGGVLGDRGLEAGVLVAILAPRWLAGCEGEERELGLRLLEQIVNEWLAAADGDAEALDEDRAAFESWGSGVAGNKRVAILADYYRDTRLFAIERALDEVELVSVDRREPSSIEAIRLLVDQAASIVDESPRALHAELWRSINERLQKLRG